MQKLYKYRPLSPFHYKELQYQELYFASYPELNDPLDLSTRVEFSVGEVSQIDVLLWFLFKTGVTFSENITKKIAENNRKLIQFVQDQKRADSFKQSVYEHLIEIKGEKDFVFSDDAEKAISLAINDHSIDFSFNLPGFFDEVKRLTDLFLLNSHVSCFSETYESFLMWAHYADSHHGICLEFSLNRTSKFPYEVSGGTEFSKGSYIDGFAEGTSKVFLFEDHIKKVNYTDKEECINFFEFSPVFTDEHNADLKGISKSRWHGFAYDLQYLFSNKTANWEYEKEWRAIDINFDGAKEPEERVRHYPVEVLTAIYFGYNMTSSAKNRIYKLYKNKRSMPKLMEGRLSADRQLIFEEWLPAEE